MLQVMKRYLTAFKITIAILLINGLCLLPMVSKAQEASCEGDSNPYDSCPLDTWVWVLAVVVVTFVVINLKQKMKQSYNNTL